MRVRPRRLRRTPVLREAVAETHVRSSQLIQPHFVIEEDDAVVPMEGQQASEVSTTESARLEATEQR